MTIDTSTRSVSTLSGNRRVDELLARSAEEIIVASSFQKKLALGKKLRVKMGFDPTKPDLHLGHMVGLRLLKELQGLGHKIIFVIGDYTAKIGDPSGRKSSRPVLTDAEIKANTDTYFRQVGKILDTEKAEIRCNSEWLGKLTLDKIIELEGLLTVAQVIERDDFAQRLKAGNDIGLHELLYPLLQAYDSVVLKADVEVGGTDQKFNMLTGRDLQKKMGQAPQDIITVKLLLGLDGKEKMSKSTGNYIGITDAPGNMFGKVMSLPDDLIIPYYELATDVTTKAIKVIAEELKNGKNPRDVKTELAKIIVETYHDVNAADQAAREFDKVFSKREKPSKMPIKKIADSECRLDDLLLRCQLATSKSEAARLVRQGGVEIEGEKITDPLKIIQIKDEMIIQVGKRRFVKIKK